MKQISDLALNKQQAEEKQAAQKRLLREQRVRRAVPTLALVVANLIFLSLDVRAFDVVAQMTGSILLASATVLVSGILALFWWDVLYPHSRKYSNKAQTVLASVGTVGGILLSLILAFLDYLVGSIALNESLLWGFVIILTGAQAILLAWWWMIDDSRQSEAKRQKSLASRIELQEHTADFQAEIESMSALSAKLEEIKNQFPGRGQAAKAARAMGYPILAQMLEDDDDDGIPNYQDDDWNTNPKPAKDGGKVFNGVSDYMKPVPPWEAKYEPVKARQPLGIDVSHAEPQEGEGVYAGQMFFNSPVHKEPKPFIAPEPPPLPEEPKPDEQTSF